MKKKYKLYRNSFSENIVIVTGITSSGKSLIAPIISSLKSSEKVMFNFLLEQIPMLNYIGKMDDDTAEYLLKYSIDNMIYDERIGRNTNFRFNDESSIWNTNNPKKYFKRLFENEGNIVLEGIKKENPLIVSDIEIPEPAEGISNFGEYVYIALGRTGLAVVKLFGTDD